MKSYFLITLPDSGFGISAFPSCNTFVINKKIIKGSLSCKTTGLNIAVQGLETDIPIGFEIGINIQLTNPK